MEYKTFLKNAKEEYNEQLIDAISNLFLEYGIENLKMTDIADHLHLGVASLYRYYKTKSNLVLLCGIHLWKKEINLFEGIFDTENFHQKNGIEQIEELLKIYLVLYEGHRPFLEFLHNFDVFVFTNHISKEDLKDYEASIMDVYPLLLKAYEKGIEDGSVKRQCDFKELYFTSNHTLLSLAQKLLPSGMLLESDYFVSGRKQLELLIQMIVVYLKGDN